MAGVSDAPFRRVCLALGADLAVHEMVSANVDLKDSNKSMSRLKDYDGQGVRWVQIVGADPETIASGASYNVSQGADVIDINMGCPAKKVCKKAAGSALLADPGLVRDILEQTVAAVTVPVTLKIRTGTDAENRNAVEIAKIAERAGVQCLTIHGRTRADRFRGDAEYTTIRDVREAISIPLIANGDITDGQKAEEVLEYTQADGLMVGRAAYGNPWIFAQIKAWLNDSVVLKKPQLLEAMDIILDHISQIHMHYGEFQGVRISRKHIGWYLDLFDINLYKQKLNKIESSAEQIHTLQTIFSDYALPKAS
jgi:tRNA-dihydrouridine synthase B